MPNTITFFFEHPYLFADLLQVACVVAGYAVAGGQRLAMLIGGLSLVPTALLALIFAGSYWSPAHVVGGPVGELAFAIVVGGAFAVCLGYGLDADLGAERRRAA